MYHLVFLFFLLSCLISPLLSVFTVLTRKPLAWKLCLKLWFLGNRNRSSYLLLNLGWGFTVGLLTSLKAIRTAGCKGAENDPQCAVVSQWYSFQLCLFGVRCVWKATCVASELDWYRMRITIRILMSWHHQSLWKRKGLGPGQLKVNFRRSVKARGPL